MTILGRCACLFICAVLSATLLAAEPVKVEDLPESLRDWAPWVLYGQEEQRCPFLYNNGAVHHCLWPSRLSLSLDATGGRFSQDWQVYERGWAALPGDAMHWPQQVEVNGNPVAVTARNGLPFVELTAGLRTLTGQFFWDGLPEALTIPAATGLLDLGMNGSAVAFPDLSTEGRLWLQRRIAEGAGEE